MNRIVLIGNGFDLANDYKTSYNNFIVWYFKNKLVEMLTYPLYTSYDKILCIRNIIELYIKEDSEITEKKVENFIKDIISQEKKNLEINEISPLLLEIVNSYETKGWVDIESDYYTLLHKYIEKNADDKVKKLNEDLDFIKGKLIEYLDEVCGEEKKIYSEIQKKIFEPFKVHDIAVEAKGLLMSFLEYRLRFSDQDLNKLCSSYELKRSVFLSKGSEYKVMLEDYLENGKPYDNGYTNLSYPDNIMLLNFNYTDIADRYLLNDCDIFSVVHIHGKLDDHESVIFGYGDELDEKYREIQELNKNEYLTNIKSIKYLESDNYRKVLSFVESDCYQVYVMGHSCGNSDRTLLNTLFEHKNCVSIKPFYYVDKDTGKDNYLDIVQNISRNFTDMKLMRDRVVNKQFCEQLRKK